MLTLHEQAAALLEDFDLELDAHPNLRKLCSLLSEPKHFAMSKDIRVMLDSLLSGMETYLSLPELKRDASWAEVEGVAGAGLQTLEMYCTQIKPGKYTLN